MTPKQIETKRNEIARINFRIESAQIRITDAIARNDYAQVATYSQIISSDAFELKRLATGLILSGMESI